MHAADMAVEQLLQSVTASCLTLWFLQAFRGSAVNTPWLTMSVAMMAAVAGLGLHHGALCWQYNMLVHVCTFQPQTCGAWCGSWA